MSGDRITRGIDVKSLDREKKWKFHPVANKGDKLQAGDQLGYVQENDIIRHKIMVPAGSGGEVIDIYEGEFTIEQTIAKIKLDIGEIKELSMLQKWPVRKGRPYKEKLPPSEPMVTGQRVIDTFFPIARGGSGGGAGAFRFGQNSGTASAGEMGGRRYNSVCGLRRKG